MFALVLRSPQTPALKSCRVNHRLPTTVSVLIRGEDATKHALKLQTSLYHIPLAVQMYRRNQSTMEVKAVPIQQKNHMTGNHVTGKVVPIQQKNHMTGNHGHKL